MSRSRTKMFAKSIHTKGSEGGHSVYNTYFSRLTGGSFRCFVIVAWLLLSVFMFQADVLASDLNEFIGRRITKVDVVIEGAPNSNVAEMKSLVDVAPGQDFSPVRIHDSLIRLYRSGLISAARVEGSKESDNGVAIQFIVKPQARIENVVFEGTPVFPAAELRARLNQLDPGERLSIGGVTRGLGDLTAYYSARGYYQSKISYDVRLDSSATRATVVYTINPGEQATVSSYKLTIKGDQIDLSRIKQTITEGQAFNQALVQEQVDRIKQALLQKNYLAAHVTGKATPNNDTNAVAVSIDVETGPRVEVVVEGLKIDQKEKNKVLPFYTQGGVDEFTIEEGRRSLLDYAQRKGYFFADVTRPKTPDLSAGPVKVVYNVDPGGKYKLSNIEIEGVDAIPHRTLEDAMKTKEAIPIPFVGGRGFTSDDLLRQDANLILKRLRALGYRRAHVDVRRGVNVKGEKLIITFDVQQGPRTYVEEIGLRGNDLLTTAELSSRITIKPGDPLVESVVTQDADELLAAYTKPGYASAEVTFDAVELGRIDGQERARLVFNIFEGNRARIAGVTTRGASVTNTGRLERDFYLFKKGDWLRNDLLQETERQLYDTNAFNSVTISSDAVGQVVNGVEERAVTVNVLEAKRRDVVYGIGYQTNTSNTKAVPGLEFLNGLRGLTQLTYSNLFGRVYTGSTQVRVAENELFGQLSFQNPRPFGENYPIVISIFARRLGEKDFRTDRYTVNFQVEKRYSQDVIAYFSYYFERISIFDLPPDFSLAEIQRNAQPIRLGRIGPSFIRDKRDNKFDPTAGNLTVGSLFIAATALGGTEQFVKLTVEHTRYYAIRRFRDTIYSVTARVGLATPFGGKDSLPISERFFGGGARDLRGFGFEEAGPQIVVRKRDVDGNIEFDSEGNPILVLSPLGGNALLVINNELTFPLWGPLGGAVFSDTGNVFARIRDFTIGNMTETVGVGLRLKTPVGPIRFDYGFLVVNRPPGVSRSHKHFTVGQAF
ncbi:MAG TPA: POTRA domain-containing protein [Blastocatellia bacterium]|nr:POTRA domain-containing protein [Blastocatellia bacterium]